MIKLGRGPQGDALYQISRLKALRFQTRKIFHVSPYISLCKGFDSRGAIIFGPRGIVYTNLLEVHKVMLHTKYQSSRPYGFRQEDLFMFLPISAYVKHVITGAWPYLAPGILLNKLGRGPPDVASYQISRL